MDNAQLFAGNVFTEWYWTPIFFVILAAPWILLSWAVMLLVGYIYYKKSTRTKPKHWDKIILILAIVIGSGLSLAYARYDQHKREVQEGQLHSCVTELKQSTAVGSEEYFNGLAICNNRY